MGLVSITFSLFRATQTKKRQKLQQIVDASTMNALGSIESEIKWYLHNLEKAVDDKEKEAILIKVSLVMKQLMLKMKPIIHYGYDIHIPKEFASIFEHVATISEYAFTTILEDNDDIPFVAYSICINEEALKKREGER